MALSIKFANGVAYVGGILSENSDLSPLMKPGQGSLLVNWRDLQAINSAGARILLNFVGSWNGRRVRYIECSAVLTDAVAMLPALLGPIENTAIVESFMAPYYCAECQNEVSLLIESRTLQLQQGVLILPSWNCPKCGSQLDASERSEDLLTLVEAGAFETLPPAK